MLPVRRLRRAVLDVLLVQTSTTRPRRSLAVTARAATAKRHSVWHSACGRASDRSPEAVRFPIIRSLRERESVGRRSPNRRQSRRMQSRITTERGTEATARPSAGIVAGRQRPRSCVHTRAGTVMSSRSHVCHSPCRRSDFTSIRSRPISTATQSCRSRGAYGAAGTASCCSGERGSPLRFSPFITARYPRTHANKTISYSRRR